MSEPIIDDETPATRASLDAPPTRPPGDSPAPACDPTLLVPPGYAILGEIARGGMGVVYRADDSALNRPVALKYLQGRYAGHPSAVGRFLYEAKVTVRLQHPGIPPVHAVGTLSDGRPFLAMKLIQGRNLAELLRDRGPGAGRWLGTFEAICQAVAYAHAQGVIHRDLKPANVMVGAFGEVQVMDWGLAKILSGHRRESPESLPEDEVPPTVAPDADPACVPGTDETLAGTVLGTPAYMPPEQAIGAIAKLDRRSDVFGLGAILCELLTGEPPFLGADSESTRQLAAQAKLADAFARLETCDAEPELLALAKRCLAAERDDRPADAGALAAEVAQLRQAAEDRARQAEIDRVRDADRAEQEKARARVESEEQGRRRRLTRIAAGLVFAVLVAGIAGTTFGLYKATGSEREATKQREKAETKRQEAEKAQADAEKAQADAEKAQADAEKARGVAETRRIEAETLRELARQRYRLALNAFNGVVFGIQNKLENRPATQELRKDLLTNAQKGLRKLLEEAERQGNPDSTLVWAHLRMDAELVLGNTAAALAEYQAGHGLAQRLADADGEGVQARRDLSVSLSKLGNAMLRLGKTKEALARYSRCVEIDQRLADDAPKTRKRGRDLSVSLNKLGGVMLRLGKPKEAHEHHSRSVKIDQQLADDAPSDAQAQRDLSVSLDNLGNVVLRLGKTMEARAHYGKSLEIRQRLAVLAPNDAQAQRDLSVSLNKLGDVMLRLGKTKEAQAHYSKSAEVCERLADADRTNAQAQRDLSVSLDKLGDAMLRLGKTKEAHAHYGKSLEIRQRLADADPTNAQAQRDLSVSLDTLGDAMLRLGKAKEAQAHYGKSLEVRQRLADADPTNAQARRDLSVSLDNLGDAMLYLGKTKEALAHYMKSLEICQRLADADSGNAQAQMDLFSRYGKLGSAEKAQHDYAKASAWFAKGRAVLLPWHEKKLLVGQQAEQFALVERQLVFCENADQAIARLSFALARPPAQVTALLHVRVRALLYRRHVGDAIRTAECWRDWAETRGKARDVQRYHAASALALCAAASTQRDVLVGKAVAVLTKLRDVGFFEDEQHRAHFTQDADFASVREHPAFAAFVRTLAKQ